MFCACSEWGLSFFFFLEQFWTDVRAKRKCYIFLMAVLCSLQYVALSQFVKIAFYELILFFFIPLMSTSGHEIIIPWTSLLCPHSEIVCISKQRTCYSIRCLHRWFFTFICLYDYQAQMVKKGAKQSRSSLFVRLFQSVPWIGSWRQLEIRLSNEALNKVMINCQTLSNDILRPQVPSLA